MPSTLDELMSLDPLELSAQDIDAIIAYQRKARASYESGVRPKKGGPPLAAPEVKEKLALLGLVPKAPTIKRRKFT